MPGPGPRGPRQTYRAPCSSILDPRISARNPRKPGNSRGARRTRTRQSGTRSTRDGLLFVKSGCKHPDPRPVRRPRTRPVPTSSTREPFFLPFFVVFAQNRQKTAEPGRQIWSEFSAKNRELTEIRQFCPNFFAFLGRVASAAERNPAHGSPDRGRGSRAGGPGLSGQLTRPVDLDRRAAARGPGR